MAAAVKRKRRQDGDTLWYRWMSNNLTQEGARTVAASMRGDRLASVKSDVTAREVKNRTFEEERDVWLALKETFSGIH